MRSQVKFLDLIHKRRPLAPHEGFIGLRADGALRGSNGDIDGEFTPFSPPSSTFDGFGEFLFVPAAPLRPLLEEDGALEITPLGNEVRVKRGNITLTLGIFGDEYPPLVLPPRPGEEEGFGVEVPAEKAFLRSLGEAMRTVVRMTSQEGTGRPIFQGVQVEYGGAGGAGFRVVATDGYRLALKELEAPEASQALRAKEFSFLVPRKWVSGLAGLLEEGERGTLYPNATGAGVVIEGDSWIARLYVRTIPGKLPPYEALIPQGPWGCVARFEAEEALKALERLSPLSDEGKVKVFLGPEGLKLEVSGPYGGGEALVEAKAEGTASAFFLSEHLSDALRGGKGEVEMKFLAESHSTSPVLIESEGYKSLIVPLNK